MTTISIGHVPARVRELRAETVAAIEHRDVGFGIDEHLDPDTD
ncbi:hypothetical protein [Micromonospora sp. WMMD1082]|nr:hypothetical protein [Micromonospora sp. WMMD1082]MDG4793654.1 hypothetical protein [Micromonospora sp. WMMD1082]